MFLETKMGQLLSIKQLLELRQHLLFTNRGIFGLGTQPVNYTDLGNFSAPSYFSSLKVQNLIPSLSWSYTAGAKYQLKGGQFSQLIFGGYDSSRYTRNTANFTLSPDITRDIVVAVQQISFSGTTQEVLLPKLLYAFIESTDPNFWLPAESCRFVSSKSRYQKYSLVYYIIRAFEKAFGISVDNSTGLYLLNATQYAKLHATNPSVTFTLSNSLSSGKSVNIFLPFDSFALSATPPFVPNATFYFPLKEASNDTQYTLGRTFLQEAYLTVNYERGNFSVIQCTFDDGSASQITTIPSITSDGTEKKSNGIGAGPLVGIVIAIIAFIILIGASVFLYLRRKKRRDVIEPRDVVALPLPEPSYTVYSPSLSTRSPEPQSINPKTENDSNVWTFSSEMESDPITIPMKRIHRQRSELSDTSQIRPELPAADNREGTLFEEDQQIQSSRIADRTAELDGSGVLYELDAEPKDPTPKASPGLSPTEPVHLPSTAGGLHNQVNPDTNAEDQTPVQPTSWLDMSERIAGSRRTGSSPVSPLRPEERERDPSTSALSNRGGSRYCMRDSLGVSSPLSSNTSNESLYKEI
ncbi:hypothetical protein HYALB_00004204 [Hymenoscyphus albidus]|uniref:Peptidase A1 domain-containing protein n=1 Tax=Hymenoscyphus albidus TaxID=595503 RepID=A0A9N9M4V3_9HELO|nr:hypothetical protein HYALB_00004204 [Hymenoscyphus albidus]